MLYNSYDHLLKLQLYNYFISYTYISGIISDVVNMSVGSRNVQFLAKSRHACLYNNLFDWVIFVLAMPLAILIIYA